MVVSTAVRAAAVPVVETVVSGTEFVTGIAFTRRGEMIVNERTGTISRVTSDGISEIAHIDTTTAGETGLLGLALDSDRRAFVFATDPGGLTNRIVQVDLATGETEVVIAELPAERYHNGGGVAFDGGGRLLVTNGEQHDAARAQDPQALGGKVYRFTTEGAIAPSNPFGESPSYAIGLRNPYGIAIDPVSGNAFVTENGPSSHDEVNRIVAGGNYGWPTVSGPGALPESAPGNYFDPLIDHESIVVPTGIAFADPEAAINRYAGDLFYGTYGEGAIRRAVLNETRDAVVSSDVFVDVGKPVIAVAWGPRGLYFSTPDAIKVVALAKGRRAREGEAANRSVDASTGRRQRPEPPSLVPSGSPFSSPGFVAGAVVLALALLMLRTRLRP